MFIFEDIQDVEEWLDPFDYLGLWDAVAPYQVFVDEDREHCDGLIARGEVRQETILAGLKVIARLALTQQFGLKDRIIMPIEAQYVGVTH